jgi:hypothetical protein
MVGIVPVLGSSPESMLMTSDFDHVARLHVIIFLPRGQVLHMCRTNQVAPVVNLSFYAVLSFRTAQIGAIMNSYEVERLENIKHNQRLLADLNLQSPQEQCLLGRKAATYEETKT